VELSFIIFGNICCRDKV